MRKIKEVIVTTLCLLVILGTVGVEAGTYTTYTTYTFTKKDVDSNSYTTIMSTTKLYDSSISTVEVTEIYKADGSASDYNYVWVKVSGGFC